MKHSHKVILNTFATFGRIAINGISTLVATRIALNVLGAADYGLYDLLAGTVSMMTFISTALTISSQRFFSIAIGKKDEKLLNNYYNTSFGIHLILAIIISILLLSLKPLFFGGFLNISTQQIAVGQTIYLILIGSTVINIFTIPFSSLMNAYEDLAQLSIIDIITCLIKLAAAVVILYIDKNQLIVYTSIIFLAFIFKSGIELFWCKIKYRNLKIHFSEFFIKRYMTEMIGFVGWNTLGSLSSVGKAQGLSIILNIFFGIIINATYGISKQINAVVISLASSLTMVFSPMIISAKGAGDIIKMRQIAQLSSKMAFCITSLMAMPLITNMNTILKLWLKNVPEDCGIYCITTIICFSISQLDPGINRAIYACGRIKSYQIWMSIISLSILPFSYLACSITMKPYSVLYVLFFGQIVLLFNTLYHAKIIANFDIKKLLFKTIIPEFVIFLSIILIMWIIGRNSSTDSMAFVILSSFIMDSLFVVIFYKLLLDKRERQQLSSVFHSFIRRERIHD